MTYLHTGKMLDIDLSNGSIRTESSEEYIERFLGARGINAAILYENTGPEVEPLDEQNVLIFGIGPLTGTSFPASPRTEVAAKSPVTGGVGCSNFGGIWGPQAKWAGYDEIIVRGKADKPVFILVKEDGAEIRDAGELWGHDTYETQDKLREMFGDKVESVCIGPAGENLVTSACLVHRLGNAAGRTGMGAVMGSKNLKAIAIAASRREPRLARKREFAQLTQTALKALTEEWFTKEFAEWGFTRWVDFFGKKEYLAAGNYRNYDWDSWDKGRASSAARLWETSGAKKYGCYRCPAPCMEHYEAPGLGDTVISCCFYFMTWGLKMTDMPAFLEISALCQRKGMDVNAFMNLAGWLMELYEKKIINDGDTEGVALKWGDRDAALKIMGLLVERRGIGDILAEGADTAARKLGAEARKYLMHVNGNPAYMLNHQAYRTVGLSAAVGSRSDTIRGLGMPDINLRCIQGYVDEGIDKELLEPFINYYTNLAQDLTGLKGEHLIKPEVYEGKAKIVEYYEDVIAISDILGTCKFLGPWFDMPLTPELEAKAYSAGKGVETSPEDLFKAARRAINVERAYNAREGRGRDDDTLPRRFFNEPAVDGEFKGERMHRERFERIKDEYYTLRGWDVGTGLPSRETLMASGLGDVADDLRKRGRLPG
ncbi:MAG: hypothetical protein IBX68_02215 [Dehalococcoidia bacterium]|nr:hypothetical protein [Dehalococcoidia bacterium]